MLEKFSIKIPQLTGDKERMAYVYLPVGYEEDEDTYYPVLYMFDGQNLFEDEEASFGQSWLLGEYLDYCETPIIIAAIESNDDPDGGRMVEYSPFSDDDPDYDYIEGKGDVMMDFYINEFKPFIDENYRTLPDREHTFIGGSSMGGHMSLYAILSFNDVFSKAAVLSPTLWFGHDDMITLIEEAEIDPYTVVYTDYGTFEFDEYDDAYDQYKELVNLLMDKDVILTSRLVPFGDHSEYSWHKQIPFFIDVLMYDCD